MLEYSSIFLRRQPCRFLEQLGEVREVAVSDGHGDVADAVVAVLQLRLRSHDFAFCRIIRNRLSGFLAEQAG
ncbi:hypothetical protein D3C85_1853470 [compost metagenome]